VGRTEVSHQHGPGVNPDPRPQGRTADFLPGFTHQAKIFIHGQGCCARLFGMIRLIDGRAEDGHEFISDILFEGPLKCENMIGHFSEIFTQKLNHLMGLVLFGDGGETDQV